jgi:hypothetical protein
MNKLIKNWAILFVVLFIWSYVWHNILLAGMYAENLPGIARMTNGVVTPNMLFLALGNIIAIFGLAYFVPAVSPSRGKLIQNGILMGLCTWGSFAVIAYAIFANWTTPLMLGDVAYSITAGAIGGYLLSVLGANRA